LLATKASAEKAAKELEQAKNATVMNTSVTSEKVSTEKTATATTAAVATTPEKAEAPTVTKPAASSVSTGSVQGAAFGVQGTPYLYGGVTTSGFDCSGFTQYAFRAAGVNLPRTASAQYSASTKISQSEAKAGDLVFFNQTGSIDHVGIYLGNGSFIGAQSSSGVAVAQINQYYWAQYVVGYGRVN
jgi:cell wall-associated NlpC family hydrolase